jgi:Glutamine amidotransferase domain
VPFQRHGGPDGQGRVYGTAWSVGSNRLAITDPDGGRQPYELLNGRITVVFNGEIYNHNELRRRLRAAGCTFPDHCDGSILPAPYHAYGDSFTEHLDGMYAIAVLDRRAEPRLVLTTDHISMKPLYHRWEPASGASICSPPHAPDPDLPQALAGAAEAGSSPVNLDGVVIPTDRVKTPGPNNADLWWPGEHQHRGGNARSSRHRTGAAVDLRRAARPRT